MTTIPTDMVSDDHGHDHEHHNHEPLLMIAPLALLAIGALLAGYLNFPGASSRLIPGPKPIHHRRVRYRPKPCQSPPEELAQNDGSSPRKPRASADLMILSGLISFGRHRAGVLAPS